MAGKKKVVIFTHIAPDGDAMGSSLGLLHWLTAQGIEATVVVPTKFPPFLAWMPGAERVLVHELVPEQVAQVAAEADLAFCLDFNEPKRIGNVAPVLLSLTCPKVLVDHHLHPDETMADVVISYPQAPAASYLVLELINQLGGELTQDAATCIYTGLMTDTGNFAFNSNNPVLYEMVAQLLRAGINKDQIFDSVFNQFSVDRLRFTGFCLYHKMRIFPKYHTALIALTSDELKRFNFQSGDAEGIVNMPLQIGTIYYSVFMREDVDKIKLSFRSQGDRPVNIFAHDIFNGGGHMNASGGEFFGTISDAVRTFENNYQKYFQKSET